MQRAAQMMVLVLVVFGLLSARPAASGELQQQLTAESAIEQIAKRGVLRVGMDVFVPWAMKDKKGELIGLEIDIARRLAEDMGVKVEFVPTEWSGIIPSLIAGKFDLIIGGMTVTAERNLKINFTNPYYYTGQGLLANRKMTEGFTIDDFNKPEVTLAARLGSTAAWRPGPLPQGDPAAVRQRAGRGPGGAQRPGARHGLRPAAAGAQRRGRARVAQGLPGPADEGAHRHGRAQGRCGHPQLPQQLDRGDANQGLDRRALRLLVRHHRLAAAGAVSRG